MATKTVEQKVARIAAKVDGEVYAGYSGRCMFGARCWGVTCHSTDVAAVKAAGRRAKLGDASVDNMGLDMIVYWTDAEWEPEPEPAILPDHPAAKDDDLTMTCAHRDTVQDGHGGAYCRNCGETVA